MQHQLNNTQNREVSSSNDQCNCVHCKNQTEIELQNKKLLPYIHVYHHLKKRQGPPDKKEANKDSSFKHRPINKQTAATPVKHKVDRSKEAYNALVAHQYHMVSHSQRDKQDFQHRRDEKVRLQGKSTLQITRQGQINQNSENSRLDNMNNVAEGRSLANAIVYCSKHLQPHQG